MNGWILTATAGGAALSDAVQLLFAVLGIVFVLYAVLWKLISWKEEHFTVTLVLRDAEEGIFERIETVKNLMELGGIRKKCTVVILNCGAPEWFCERIRSSYRNCEFLVVVPEKDAVRVLAELDAAP